MDRGAWRATVHGVAKEVDMTCHYTTNNKNKTLFISLRKFSFTPSLLRIFAKNICCISQVFFCIHWDDSELFALLAAVCPDGACLRCTPCPWVSGVCLHSPGPLCSNWGHAVQSNPSPRSGFLFICFLSLCVLSRFGRVQLFVTPWSVAREAPLSIEFSRQKYWWGLLCPLPGDVPEPGIKSTSEAPATQVDFLLPSHWGSPFFPRVQRFPQCYGGSLCPSPSEWKLFLVDTEEKDPEEFLVPLHFHCSLDPGLYTMGVCKSLLSELFLWEEKVYEKMRTPRAVYPPGTVTLPPACQSVQRPSPIHPHSVAQGAESGWHLSSPCRQDATLGFSPVLALWFCPGTLWVWSQSAPLLLKGWEQCSLQLSQLRAEAAGLSDEFFF